MPEVLVIQNSRNEGIGFLGELLATDGFKIRKIFAKTEDIPSEKPHVIIILGAPESANDDLSYLKEELRLIRDSVKKEIPILGICLGSQLIAKAFGGMVYRGNKKEIGFYNDIQFDNISKSNLFAGIKSPATVFHWHGDTFDLPTNAIRLAYSKHYKNQAFKLGSAVGIQFHLEVDEPTIRLWIKTCDPSIYEKVNKISERVPQDLGLVQDNMKIFYQNFKLEFNL